MKNKIVVASALLLAVGFSVGVSASQAQASVYDRYVAEYSATPQPTTYEVQDAASDVQGAIRTATLYALILALGFYLVRWTVKKVRPADSIGSAFGKGPVIIIAVLALGGGFYYWFSIRPANIRRECLKAMGREPTFASKAQVGKYEACLIEHGLTP